MVRPFGVVSVVKDEAYFEAKYPHLFTPGFKRTSRYYYDFDPPWYKDQLLTLEEEKRTTKFWRIEHSVSGGHWMHGANFETLEAAQIELADAHRYPLDRSYRIVRVTETVEV